MPAYEVSNHARDSAQSRHNRVYWRYGDYVGIGPGAHGRLTLGGLRHATEAARAPGDWLMRAESGSGDILRDALTPEDAASEFLLMGLRLTEGVDPGRYAQIRGAPLSGASVAYLVDLDMITTAPNRVRTTPQGRLVLNAVIARLLEG
jgi:oxygen-independent coproporphyrinogen-3 oxidase